MPPPRGEGMTDRPSRLSTKPGNPAMEQTPHPNPLTPSTDTTFSPPNEHPPHGVGVQDPPAATRSASGRSRTPPPHRRATKPSGEHRNENQRVATSGLDRPHSFRNDLSGPDRVCSRPPRGRRAD